MRACPQIRLDAGHGGMLVSQQIQFQESCFGLGGDAT